jgi:drug/metabolite transporter (DMT)-like permease
MSSLALALTFAFLAAFMWGIQSVIARKGLIGIGVIPGTFISVLMSVPVILVAGLISGDLLGGYTLRPIMIVLLVLIGVLSQMVSRILLYGSFKIIGASRATPITSIRSLFGSFLGIIFLGEEPTTSILLGTFLIFFGVILISYTEAPPGDSGTEGKWKGISYVLVAGLLWGTNIILIRIAVLDVGSAIIANLVANLAAMVSLGLLIPFRGYYSTVLKINRSSLFYLLLAGAFMAIASLSNFIALGLGPVIIIAPITGTVPLFTIVVSYFFLQRLERVNLMVISGAISIVLGTYFVAASPF